MKAKKLALVVLVVFVVALLSGAVCAAERKIGHLSKLNVTPEEMRKISEAGIKDGKVKVFTSGGKYSATRVFYDSLTSLVMGLNAGEVDEISLPEPVAEYVMNVNSGLEVASIVRTPAASLALGFRKDIDPTLRDKINKALRAMNAEGSFTILRAKYINQPGLNDPEPVKFYHFDRANTLKVAVTGDMPPIDFIAADGTPAGFNTAVLAELADRMQVNIQLVNIDSGARAAALASKRVDVVFWFASYKDFDVQPDVPEGVVLSEPYYTWKHDLLLKKK